MNRFAKGAIAGAAGIILLLSGAGSFALWNGSASAAAGTVQSGTMTIARDAVAGTWSVTHGGVTSAIPNIALFHAVPGDTLTLTQKVDITASGDNLSALLTVDPLSIKPSSSNPVAPADAALATALANGLSVTAVGTLPPGVTSAGSNSYKVAGSAGSTAVTLAVSLLFDPSTTGATAQGGSVDLGNLAFTLTQQ